MQTNRKSRTEVVRMVILLLSGGVAAFLIQYLFSDRTDFSDFDLGTTTHPVFAKIDSVPIHFSAPSLADEAVMLEDVKASQKSPLLILGNSQTHGINRFEEGQANLVEVLHNELPGQYVFAHTLANANLQELYVLFRHWLRRVHPKLVLVPVFFDDTREDNLRQDLAPYADLAKELRDSDELGQNLATQLDAMRSSAEVSPKLEATATEVAPDKSLQESTEAFLDKRLSDNFPIWRKRPSVRGELFLKLYFLRNTLLGLSSQSQRPILPGPLKRNLTALEDLLKLAQSESVRVLLYIPPLRQDVQPPYDKTKYAQFKSEVESLAASYSNVAVVDLDKIVPDHLWGMKESTNLSGRPEYDFMHFSSEGHKILAEALKTQIEKLGPTL